MTVVPGHPGRPPRPQSDWSPIGIFVCLTNWSPKFQNEPILVKNVKNLATEYIPLYKYGKIETLDFALNPNF